MTTARCCDWIARAVHRPSVFTKKQLLVWDRFAAHTTADTCEALQKAQIESLIIPGGCTGFVQPGDVSWNKPFKERIRACHETWIRDPKNSTPRESDTIPPIPPEVYLEWVVQAWDGVSQEVIRRAFTCCGLCLPTDGSRDCEIACLAQIPDGLERLKSAREAYSQRTQLNSGSEDDEDEEEPEEKSGGDREIVLLEDSEDEIEY